MEINMFISQATKRENINLNNKRNLRTFKNDLALQSNVYFGLASLTYSEAVHQHNQLMKLARPSNVLLVKLEETWQE